MLTRIARARGGVRVAGGLVMTLACYERQGDVCVDVRARPRGVRAGSLSTVGDLFRLRAEDAWRRSHETDSTAATHP